MKNIRGRMVGKSLQPVKAAEPANKVADGQPGHFSRKQTRHLLYVHHMGRQWTQARCQHEHVGPDDDAW